MVASVISVIYAASPNSDAVDGCCPVPAQIKADLRKKLKAPSNGYRFGLISNEIEVEGLKIDRNHSKLRKTKWRQCVRARALEYAKWKICKDLEKIEKKLSPGPGQSVYLITINPRSTDAKTGKSICEGFVEASAPDYWFRPIEPTCEGLPHFNLMILAEDNAAEAIEAEALKIREKYGFDSILHIYQIKHRAWFRPSHGLWPWALGYSTKFAYNVDTILEFRAWLRKIGERFWFRQSESKSAESPLGSVPSSHDPTHSTLTPTQSSTAQNLEEEDIAEHEGRILNDALSAGKRVAAAAIVEKALESARSVITERKRRSLWARLQGCNKKCKDGTINREGGILTSIRRYSSDPTVKALALHISGICKAADAKEMARFGLKSSASLIFDPGEISRLEKATKEAIERWSGDHESLERIERVLLKALADHDHALKFAAVSAAVARYVKARNLKPGMHLHDQLKKQLGHHFKSTGNGRWFKRDLLSMSDEAIVERIRGTDIRSFRTRAKHGEKPDPLRLVKGSTETKSRKRTTDERALEIRCADELESLREQMALRGRFGKFNLSKAREQASKPVERIDLVKVLKKSIKKGIGIGPILQWSDEKIGQDGTQVILNHVMKVMGIRLSALPVSAV